MKSKLLIQILKTPSIVDELLEKLDIVARNYNGYEYGLPIFQDDTKAAMREVVYQWLLEYKQ